MEGSQYHPGPGPVVAARDNHVIMHQSPGVTWLTSWTWLVFQRIHHRLRSMQEREEIAALQLVRPPCHESPTWALNSGDTVEIWQWAPGQA